MYLLQWNFRACSLFPSLSLFAPLFLFFLTCTSLFLQHRLWALFGKTRSIVWPTHACTHILGMYNSSIIITPPPLPAKNKKSTPYTLWLFFSFSIQSILYSDSDTHFSAHFYYNDNFKVFKHPPIDRLLNSNPTLRVCLYCLNNIIVELVQFK